MIAAFRAGHFRKAFTILEMLVAMAVLVMLLGLIASALNQTSSTIQKSSAQASAFSKSRSAFDLLTQRLSQASLNTYWDYDDATKPTRYLRQSDLHFVIQQNTQMPGYGQELFFQTPEAYSKNPVYQSTSGLLNACGYRIRYGDDKDFRPATTSVSRWRYRLMQSLQSTDALKVFQDRSAANPAWLSATSATELPIADNIIALIVWPRLPLSEDAAGTTLSTDYHYNSRENASADPQPSTANQLPPVVQVTIVAISEAAASRLDTHSSTAPSGIESALAGKFTKVSEYTKDLAELSLSLTKMNIQFQIFTIGIVMRDSKWSP